MAKGKYEEWLKPEKLVLVAAWARNGLTDKQIARNIGISESTLNEWKKSHPEFAESLKENKEVADSIVENALFIRAQGQYVTVKKPIKVKTIHFDPDTGRKTSEEEEIREAEELMYIPPDTTAQIFWLKNRKPDTWRTKPETETENEQKEAAGIIEMPTIKSLELREE